MDLSVVYILMSKCNLIVLAMFPEVFGSESLNQLGPCACEIGGDKVVDLSPLAFKNDTSRYKDIQGDYYKYSWNPCYDFNEGSCRGVAGCQLVPFSRNYFPLGSQDSAKFQWSDQTPGQLQLVYQSKTGMQRTLFVTLVCTTGGQTERIVAAGERLTEPLVYDLKLYSPHACASSIPADISLSIGSLILITSSLVVFVYVIAGVIFQVFVCKSSGVHVIPNLSFWITIPGLIKRTLSIKGSHPS
ncbi:uncharacterized protein [Littorina saxatilis]|uniref:uncharacterized protein n=1 Tax=Littorina saxatilis TaxID=31220 RepID=UPI0038B5CE65